MFYNKLNIYFFKPLLDNVDYLASEIPEYLYNIIILFAGLLIAKLVYIIVSGILRNIKFDLLIDKAGILEIVEGIIKDVPSRIIARLCYWLVIIIIISIIVTNFGFTDVPRDLLSIVVLFTKIFSFFSFILIGYILATFIGKLFSIFLSLIGIEFYKPVMNIFMVFCIYGAVYYSLPIIGIDEEVITDITGFALKTIMAVAGISLIFGLKNYFYSFYNYLVIKRNFKPGNIINLKGEKLTVNKIKLDYTYCLTHTEEKIIPNKILIKEIISR